MKKFIRTTMLTIAVTAMTAVFAMGQSGKETRNVSDFNEIGFGIAGNLHIRFGSQYSVVIEADKSYLGEIETTVRNGKLMIRQESNWHIFSSQHADVYVTMPSLKGLGVSGSGNAVVEDAIKADDLHLNVSGSGKITTNDLSATSLDCGISGSGDIYLNGTGEVEKGDFSVSGSGSFKSSTVKVTSLEVGISGSGSCTCYVKDNLKASVSGSGNVYYSGTPRLDVRTSGSGHVRSR